MTLPSDIPEAVAMKARSVAEWFVRNNSGQVCDSDNDALIDGFAQVLADFGNLGSPYGLTPALAKVLKFISDYIAAHGFSPTYSEIAVAFGIAAKSGVARMIDELEERGAIVRLPRRHRSLSIVKFRDVSAAHKKSVEA